MTEYVPDYWMIVKIESKEPHYRVFATWRGSYTGGDSWKLNSGIDRVEVEENHYNFLGASGSVYRCNRHRYGNTGYGSGILAQLQQDIKKIDGAIIAIEEDDVADVLKQFGVEQ